MKKKYLFYVLLAALLALILSRFDAREFTDSLTRVPIRSVALLAGIQIFSQLLLNLQWRQIAASGGSRISFLDMLYINSQAEIVHGIPGGHVGCDITRFVQLTRLGRCSGPQAAAVVATQKLFSLSAFFFINLFAAGFLAARVPTLREHGLQYVIYGIVSACLLAFAGFFLMPRRILAHFEKKDEPRSAWTRKARMFMTTTLDQIISIRRNTKMLASFLLLAALIWLLYPLKMYILAIQFMPDAGMLYMSATVFIAYTVAMIPIFPGGLGGFEATMTGLLLFAGFAPGDALALTVVFRFITFWFVLAGSAVFIGFYNIGWPRPKARSYGVSLSDGAADT